MLDKIFIPPKNLEDWDNSTIDSLVDSKYLESDTLDFKEDVSELEKDICGFANSAGGFIVFGIRGKDRAEEKKPLSDEHKIINQLTGKVALIDPTPKFEEPKIIKEEDKFYLVLKIADIPHLKPFNVKNSGSFYIRFNGSTQPASRTVILNLFSVSINRRQRLIMLENAIEMLTKELSVRNQNGSLRLSKVFIHYIPEIDLFFIKSSIANAGDLISDLDEIGKVKPQSFTSGLLTTTMPKLEGVNANIRGFNNSIVGSEEKQQFSNYIDDFARAIPSLNQDLDRFKVIIEKMLEG